MAKPMTEENFDTRGEATRLALIHAGLELFGEYGFKATTTRMLADHAKANVSAIPYYFKNKEGLYTGVVEYIADQVRRQIGGTLANVSAALDNPEFNKDEARRHLLAMMASLSYLFLENKEARSWALILLKEQIKPSAAFDVVYDNIMRHVHQVISTLIARVLECKPDDNIAIIKTHMLIGQILIFLSARETLLRRLGVKELTPEYLQMIQELLEQHVLACVQVAEDA